MTMMTQRRPVMMRYSDQQRLHEARFHRRATPTVLRRSQRREGAAEKPFSRAGVLQDGEGDPTDDTRQHRLTVAMIIQAACEDLQVIVVGAGIDGLTAAIALAQAGVQVECVSSPSTNIAFNVMVLHLAGDGAGTSTRAP